MGQRERRKQEEEIESQNWSKRVLKTWEPFLKPYFNQAAQNILNFNPGLEAGLILGGYMKEETLAAFEVGQKSLAEALYDAAFGHGKASVQIPADLADLQNKLVEAQAEIAKVKSDDESDKAAIAEGHAKLEAIKSILSPKVVAPIEPVVEGEAQP